MKKKILALVLTITCLFTVGFKSPTVNAAEKSQSVATTGATRIKNPDKSFNDDARLSSDTVDKNDSYDCEDVSLKQSIQFNKEVEVEIGRSRYEDLFYNTTIDWGRVDQLRKCGDAIIIETSIQ
ncbi:MAG: hypothetical protein ACI4II_01445 [Acutalibacteraceae bacterium]